MEVGAALFVAVYLAAIAFFLALEGRGFAELGARGLKSEQIVRVADDEQDVTLADQMMLIRNTEKNLAETEAALHRTATHLEHQVQRLRELEEKGN